MYLFAVGAVLVLWAAGIGSLSGMNSDSVTSSFANVFMLQTVLHAPDVPNVVWTLAYEMVFYLMLTALFLGGAHRRSSRYALVFGVAAVVLGGILHPGSLSGLLGPGILVAVTDTVILAGLALALVGRGRARAAGAALAAVTGLLVVAFNGGYAASWEAFTISALMFAGTVLYRAENGQYPRCSCSSCWSAPRSPIAASRFRCSARAGIWRDGSTLGSARTSCRGIAPRLPMSSRTERPHPRSAVWACATRVPPLAICGLAHVCPAQRTSRWFLANR